MSVIPMSELGLRQQNISFTAAKPRVASKADLARPNTHGPETLRQPGGPATHCYLCREEWRDHLTNEEEEEEEIDNCERMLLYFCIKSNLKILSLMPSCS